MYKDLIIKGVIFTAGAAIGSAVTYVILRTKYEQIVQEEIDSVKEVYSRKKIEETIEEEMDNIETASIKTEHHDEDIKNDLKESMDYSIDHVNKIAEENEYVPASEDKRENKDMEYYKAEVIPPDEFGEDETYETESLTYYADEVLTDEMDNVIDDEDIDDMITYESLTRFGEYEADSVFVRNDERKTYYEILLDERNYSDL